MTTKRVLALILVVMAMSVALARSRQGPRDEPGETYPVAGVVTAPVADGRVMVAHEEIAGYMPAMTMPFVVGQSETLPGLAVGSRVRFTLNVTGDRAWASGFVVTGHDAAVAAAATPTPAPVASTRLRKGDVLPDVSLVTQSGVPFTSDAFQGKVTAVTFIFTRCPMPEFCPLMVKRFQQIQQTIAADATLADARLLAVSLDPTFDTPPVLDAYARAMQADPTRWTFVTGTPEDVSRLTRAFAIHVERNGVLLDHTLATAVIDADGRIVEIWRGNGWKPAEVVAAMRGTVASTD